MTRRDDLVLLRDMLDAANEAFEASRGRSRADLDRDHIWALGLFKCVEIVGEAAGRVGGQTRLTIPELPWDQIIAMRNRIVHGYFDIDYDQVWNAITKELPTLIESIQRALARTQK